MSRTLSYRGTLPMGEEDRIKLKTNTGKTGYKINKFQILGTTPGQTNVEYVGKITKVKDSNIGPTVKFTDADLLAVAYYQDNEGTDKPMSNIIIFDNEKFNQDIFVNITDASGGTVECNYYIELETMKLSDLESTYLTLQSLRSISE
jgi:hypothetical protein